MDPKSAKPRELALDTVILILSDRTRWRILDTLLATEAMASVDLAKAIDIPVTNLAKHMAVLRRSGVVEQRIGRAYSIRPQYRSLADQRAIDFGGALIRLDRLAGK